MKMLPSIVKSNSIGLRDIVKTISVWTVKDVHHTCKKFYHHVQRHHLNYKRNVNFNHFTGFVVPSKLNHIAVSECNSGTKSENINSSRSDDEIQDFIEKNRIQVKGSNVPPPSLSVKEAGFPDDINHILRKNKVAEPTPIQSLCWPIALSGRDFVGISPTGSGKTLGFIIPAVLNVLALKKKRPKGNVSPYVLVLAPTRELVQQIEGVSQWFKQLNIKVVSLYGGSSKLLQMKQLHRGVDICVATPGRCNDILDTGCMDLDNCSYVVLDEADRMLDMGFLPQIEPIMEQIQVNRQILMWSATWPREVRSLAEKFLSNYVYVCIGDDKLTPNKNVQQIVKICPNKRDKMKMLVELLNDLQNSCDNLKVLVFAETKYTTDLLETFLRNNNFRASAMHGDKTQKYREICLQSFHSGRCQFLVATGVASRGLDVDDITHVINYDCPKDPDDYIHKIGRTGRVDRKGIAITIVTPDDSAGYLVQFLRECNSEIPQSLQLMSSSGSSGKKRFNRFDYKAKPYNRNIQYGKFGFKNYRKNDFMDEWLVCLYRNFNPLHSWALI